MNLKSTRSVTASAPGKLMLFGEHAVVYGHPCIVAAVNRRVHVTVEQNSNNPEVSTYYTSGVYDDRFVRAAVGVYGGFLGEKISNISITTRSEFEGISGLGSSAAVTVATMSALAQFFGKKLSKRELFDLSYKAVLQVQKVGSGFDVAASVYGDVIYYAQKGEIIEPLAVQQLPLVVGYTGVKADSVRLIQKVAREKRKRPEKVQKIFEKSTKIVEQAKEALLAKNWELLGELMMQNQGLLEQLDVSSPILDRLITAVYDAGALGAKLSGAGEGDCMIALHDVQNKPSIEKALIRSGGRVIDVRIAQEGVRIELDL